MIRERCRNEAEINLLKKCYEWSTSPGASAAATDAPTEKRSVAGRYILNGDYRYIPHEPNHSTDYSERKMYLLKSFSSPSLVHFEHVGAEERLWIRRKSG